MPDIQRKETVPYTPTQMYDLVNDVEKYPEYIPWCRESEILLFNDDEMRATLSFELGGIRKSFTTCNLLQKNKMIELSLIDGPFKQLQGFWRFEALDNHHCQISFDLNFEFESKMIGMMFGPVFHQMTNSLVDTFIERAKKIYEVA